MIAQATSPPLTSYRTAKTMKRRLLILIASGLLMLFGALAASNRPTNIYASIEIEAGTSKAHAHEEGESKWFNITYLLDPVPTEQRCEALTGSIARSILENCAFCVIKQLNCKTTLDTDQQLALSTAPLDFPSGRTNNGVVIYRASDPELAQTACDYSVVQSREGKGTITCFKPNTERPKSTPQAVPIRQAISSVLALLSAFSASWICCWLIVKYERFHAHLSHDHIDSGPQKFHASPTPRIGGLALAVGLVAAGSLMIVVPELQYERELSLLLLAGVPAFFGGLVEDITKKVGVLERLLLTMLSGAVAAWLLGATLNRIDLPYIDDALLIPAIGVVFTIFAVGGVANAINIIDGYNGLAGGYAVIVLGAFAWVAAQVGDSFILAVSLSLAGAILGFLHWNWPKGKIFLGDGGAYLLGFLLAEISALLVIRNPEVSPWFPLTLLIYPVFETCFSIYRRVIAAGASPGQPDSKHLHQLIYKWISRPNECRLAHNSRVAIYLWLPILVIAVAGASFPRSAPLLLTISMAWCIAYVVFYRLIERRLSLNLSITHAQEEVSVIKKRKSRESK